jgi:hypothetical protein
MPPSPYEVVFPAYRLLPEVEIFNQAQIVDRAFDKICMADDVDMSPCADSFSDIEWQRQTHLSAKPAGKVYESDQFAIGPAYTTCNIVCILARLSG